MAAKVIDGKQVAAGIRTELTQQVAELTAKGVTPGLGVILVGDDPASQSYVKGKHKACAEIGIYSEDHKLPAETSQEELRALIDRLNADSRIHGILLQLPLPKHLDEKELLVRIDPDKDVDGFHPMNVGKMVVGEEAFLPCTPHGIIQILMRNGVRTEGAHVVVVGRSNIVGKPIANMLIQKKEGGNATVTVCHTRTRDIAAFTRQADIIIAAAGRPGTVTAEMVKEGAVVIDVGVNRVEDASRPRGYRLVGDVEFEAVAAKASLITPVPGGVGPMTITMLMVNTVESARRSMERATR
jgi:methylenetetrahydrofolate dehydrogenase (NADP+)/methenyltetrahydrofolate cyclohydrolase